MTRGRDGRDRDRRENNGRLSAEAKLRLRMLPSFQAAGLNSVYYRVGYSSGQPQMDELRVGTTLADVQMGNQEVSSYQGLAVRGGSPPLRKKGLR